MKAKTVIEKDVDFMIEAGLLDTIEFSANCVLFTTIPACHCSSCDGSLNLDANPS